MIEQLPVLLGITCLTALVVLLFFRYRRQKSLNAADKHFSDDSMSVAERIQISKKELETVFDALNEMICIIDKDFKIVRINKSYASFAGKPIKNILGKPCYQILWNRSEICPDCSSSLTFKNGVINSKKIIVRKSSEENTYFEISSFPVLNEQKTVVHVIEFIRNITEEKRIMEQLIRSEKLASIGIMTSGIAHEMHNPLSGISGMALNLLEMPEKYGLNEKGISRVNAILEASSRAISIMRDLLYISRKGGQTTKMTPINSLLLKTFKAIHLPGSSEINFRYNLEESLPPINCDPAKIEQVIMNIGTNAIQSILEKK
ncbi:MAG: PAS domain-containing protein, partial [Fibrobacter sp.]|nr:PAS domain-containing protein [Fibrobacter sp.]